MVNPSRRKGTKAETGVVDWFHGQGHTQVERHSLHGAHDLGDITGLPGLVISVKFVGQGKRLDLSGWLNAMEVMRANVNSRTPALTPPDGVLIVRRTGYPDVGQWYAVQPVASWWDLYQRDPNRKA